MEIPEVRQCVYYWKELCPYTEYSFYITRMDIYWKGNTMLSIQSV